MVDFGGLFSFTDALFYRARYYLKIMFSTFLKIAIIVAFALLSAHAWEWPWKADLNKCTDEMMLDYSKGGELSKVQDCISGGSNVNAKDDKGNTPLMFASAIGHQSIVKTLLQAGADVRAKTNDGWTPLMIASHMGHQSVIEVLRKAGAGEEL